MKFILNILSILGFLTMMGGAYGMDVRAGSLTITDAYIRATPSAAKVTSGYLTIHNQGTEPDQLLTAHSDKAKRIEIHEMRIENDVMRMRPLRQGLELPAGEKVALAPDGYHLMIFEPELLVKGEVFPIELQFAAAGSVQLSFEIRDMESSHDTSPSDAHQHHHNH